MTEQPPDKHQPLDPINIAVIGTGDGGLKSSVRDLRTPAGQPNLIVTVVSPLIAVLIRSGHLFLTTLLGLLAAAMTPAGGALLYTGSFTDMLMLNTSLAVPIVVVGALKDVVGILGKLESKFPLQAGNV